MSGSSPTLSPAGDSMKVKKMSYSVRVWLKNGSTETAAFGGRWDLTLDNGKEVEFFRDCIAIQNPVVIAPAKAVSLEGLPLDERVRRLVDGLDAATQRKLYHHLYALGHRIGSR